MRVLEIKVCELHVHGTRPISLISRHFVKILHSYMHVLVTCIRTATCFVNLWNFMFYHHVNVLILHAFKCLNLLN